jgi:hypothetical protein
MTKPISAWNNQDLADAIKNGTATLIDPVNDKDWITKLVSTKPSPRDTTKQ